MRELENDYTVCMRHNWNDIAFLVGCQAIMQIEERDLGTPLILKWKKRLEAAVEGVEDCEDEGMSN